MSTAPEELDEDRLRIGLAALAGVDPDLAAVLDRLGAPPLWARDPGFATLVRIVLEQQVSLASAKAAYDRLATLVPDVSPERFLALSQDQLRDAGFSRQKAGYVRALANALLTGGFELGAVAGLPDAEAREALMSLKGIGRWTAEIYLLMALRRADAWPASDLALASAVMRIKRLEHRPNAGELEVLAEPWRPWRAVAARLLWHEYLSR